MDYKDHLGGYCPADSEHPHGDKWTWTPRVWDFLFEKINPKTLLDVGCGEGHHTKYFLDHNINAYGIDGSEEALHHITIPNERFILHDFTLGISPNLTDFYDLIWCCEFVEHIEAQYLDNMLGVLKRGKTVAITHAFPGQGGHHHVNCQYPGYWIAVLASVGLIYNEALTIESRKFSTPPEHWNRSGLIFTTRPV